MDDEGCSWREKLHALSLVVRYRPKLTAFLVGFGLVVTLLEGIGVGFIVPIVEIAQSPGSAGQQGGVAGAFAAAYAALGVPFTLGSVVVGLTAVLAVRYASTIVVDWLQVLLRTRYTCALQTRAFEHALDARVAYFDEEGSDDVLNAIVTQAENAGDVIRYLVETFKSGLLAVAYLGIALYLAPVLTVLAGGFMVGSSLLIWNRLESGYAVGDRVAEANERIQEHAQAGTQGIREVKLLGVADDLLARFREGVDAYAGATVRLGRNEAIVDNLYNFTIAAMVFALIYLALTFTGLGLGPLAAFLFVMFKLGPVASRTNRYFYRLVGGLPHLVRTQRFVADLDRHSDLQGEGDPVPEDPTPIAFEDVSFAYDDEPVLEDVSFRIDRGEFVAFVGQSGEGKSTIAALLARLYDADDGEITVDGDPIERFDVEDWRSRVAFVRQDPYVFDATLWRNLTMGREDVDRAEVDRVCEIAQVSEFLDDLPAGYGTELGDDGVRLSGGQRQRVALARALLQDADLLILDEATSDLDAGIESRVQANVESMDREYTVVAIAHRLSTIRDADRIYALEDGQIAERGEHGALVEREGTYAELYSAQ